MIELNGTNPVEIAIEKANIIKTAVETLSYMLPLEWTFLGKRIKIERIGLGVIIGDSVVFRNENDAKTVQFKIKVDGIYQNGDGWYGWTNPPISVPDGTQREIVSSLTGEVIIIDNYKIDPLASFFDIVEKAVS